MRPDLIKRLIAAGLAAWAAAGTPALAQSADWQRRVTRIVAAMSTYPAAAQARGEEGLVRIRVYVLADGTVDRTEMVTPSSSALLNREALGLPARARRFPAPPGGATSIVLPLTWKLF